MSTEKCIISVIIPFRMCRGLRRARVSGVPYKSCQEFYQYVGGRTLYAPTFIAAYKKGCPQAVPLQLLFLLPFQQNERRDRCQEYRQRYREPRERQRKVYRVDTYSAKMMFGISIKMVTMVRRHITMFRLFDITDEKPSIILERIPV